MNILTERYSSIELLRFIAAMAVVFVHIPTVRFGHFGVDIFFTISGFVMMLSTSKTTENFFLKRLIRIIPTYYLFTLGVFSIAVAMPSLLNNTSADYVHLLKSFLFIPFDKNGVGHHPVMFLGWTLNYEMYFYLLFALALKVSHVHRDVVVTLLLCGIYLICQSSNSLPFSAYSYHIVFEFVLGIVVYLIIVNKDYLRSLFLLLLIAASLAFAEDFDGRFYELGIGSALFVLIFIRLLSGVEISQVTKVFGGYSYALYLTHPYIIQSFDKLLNWFSLSFYYQVAALVLSIIFANLAAYLIWRLVEVPITGFLRTSLLKRIRMT